MAEPRLASTDAREAPVTDIEVIAACRAAADRDFVLSLRAFDFPRVVGLTALMWAQLVAAWVVALWGPWWAIVPAALVIVVCQQTMILWVHEASHVTLLPSRRLNDLYADLFFASPIGMNVQTYRTNHLTHHSNLGTEDDLDRWIYAIPIWSRRGWGRFLLLLLGWNGVKVAFEKYGAAILTGRDKLGEPAQLDRLAMSAVWNLGLLAICWAADRWWLYPLLWLYPVLSVTVLLNVVRSVAEHQPPRFSGDLAQLAAPPLARSTIPAFWQKWALYQVNFNYHLEHHAFPYVPFFNLPRLHRHVAAAGFYDQNPEYLQRSAFALSRTG